MLDVGSAKVPPFLQGDCDLHRGLILQQLLGDPDAPVLQAGCRRRGVFQRQNGLPEPAVDKMSVPGRVLLTRQVNPNDRPLCPQGAGHRRERQARSHLEDRWCGGPHTLASHGGSIPLSACSPGQGPRGTCDSIGWWATGPSGLRADAARHLGTQQGPVRVQEAVVDTHEEYAQCEAGGHDADQNKRVEVSGEVAAGVPEAGEHGVLEQDDAVVEGHAAAAAALLDVEPAEDVDDAHHHVVDDFLPLGHAEVRLTLDDPEGHDAPVGHNENAKVELVNAGEEREGQTAGRDGKQMPQHLGHGALVGQRPLVVP